MNWTDLPRLEKSSSRLEDIKLSDGTIAKNVSYGIHVYENAIKKDDCDKVINALETETTKGLRGIHWSGAQVNKNQDVSYVRNCVDLKFKKEYLGKYLAESQPLAEAYDIVDKALDKCLRHYESLWHLRMEYKESFNFVKYMPGKYFKIHGDHGPFYACTISAVVYLNDDYEGGELEFPRQELSIKPKAGDIALFPSNFVYEHSSSEIKSGTKYSVVIMTDYNDLHHKQG